MSPQAINRIKKKYNLDDADLTSALLQIIVDNKIYAWQRGAGLTTTSKTSSQAVIAARYFNSQNIVDAMNELMETLPALKVSSDQKKEKDQPAQNKIYSYNPIELSPNMSNAELVEFFKHELDNVTDKTKRFDLQMKMLDKLDIKANNAVEDGNKPLIYLPLRSEDYVCKKCGNH